MPELQKYTGSTNFYCTCSEGYNGLLSTGLPYSADNNELLFFGLTDGTNFKNNLKGINDKPIKLTCDQPDCNASAGGYALHPDDNTGMNINIKIPATSNSRTITFSYNGTPLFTILQQKKSTSVTYTYKVFIRNIGSNGVYPSIVSNGTLTDSPSSWSTIKIKSSIYPLCTMECYYTNSSDPYPDHIYMSNLYIAGENKAIKYYDGEEWNYGYTIKLFYFTGQNCKLQGTYNLPFGKTNDDQHFDI